MAAEKPDAGAFPIGNLFAILLLVAGVIANRLPLESARPAGDDPTGRQITGLQDVTARLWQDPFMAVDKSPAQQADNPDHAFEQVARQIRERVGNDPVTVLGVSVFGGPYAEDQEMRRRTRYAVVSALGAAAYVPWNSEKIGLIRSDTGKTPEVALPPRVPFEGYVAGANHVLVLWLDESHYAKEPLERYAALRGKLDRLRENLSLRIIGPVDSDTIDALAKQVCVMSGATPGQADGASDRAWQTSSYYNKYIAQFDRIRFFSSGATAAPRYFGKYWSENEARISADDQSTNACAQGIRKIRSRLLRVTNTDDKLAKGLVDELALRGIVPGNPADLREGMAHVAFVYEWDNLFSRIWRDEFIAATGHPGSESAIDAPGSNCGTSAPPWVHCARFMRGLDGTEARKASGGKDSAGGASADHKAGPPKAGARAEDRADGTGQFDYLLRVAEELRATDTRLREQGRDSIRAIGVIGNDPYDKLIVLQALRPLFPDTIFFTNDLDARLLQKEQYKWTRNLLVASAYGLQLEPVLQQGTPPFRDSYQTGTFLATRLALVTDDAADFDALRRCTETRLAPARMFEIGRTLAADITPDIRDTAGTRHCAGFPLLARSDGRALSVHRSPDKLFEPPRSTILGWMSMLLLLALMVSMFSRTVQSSMRSKARFLKAMRREKPLFLSAAAILALALLGAITVLVSSAALESAAGRGEPFTLFEGISMWPSEAIRLIAFLLGVTLLLRTWFDLARNRQTLKTEFALPEPIAARLRPTVPIRGRSGRLHWLHVRRWIYVWWNRRIGITGWQPDPRSVRADAAPGQRRSVDVLRLWKAYGVRSRLSARCLRIAPLLAVFLVFTLLVIETFGAPSIPYRGGAMLKLDHWLTLAFSLTAALLVFAVLDATRLCKRFVQHLQDASSNWPQSTIALFGPRFHVEELPYRSVEEHAGTLNDWIDVQFIARHTEAVGALLWYPAVVIALLVFARADVFDGWTIPTSLLAIYLSIIGCLVYLAVSLQDTADQARDKALERMRGKLIAAKGRGVGALASQIELLSAEIRDLRRGAFLPISQRPLVRTVLMGLGSLGGVELISYLNIVAR